MIATYTKKPVAIQACQWTGENLDEVMKFCAGNATYELMFRGNSEIVIQTLEDGGDKIAQHVASKGDFIIQGVKGEFYPCKPDIFEATYSTAPPAGVQGDAAREANWLCYAWGESDYPIAELAVTRDDVIRFLCEFWFGCSVENYPKDEDAVSAVAEFDAPEWDEGDTLTWKFEIGGVQITRLSAAAAQASGS